MTREEQKKEAIARLRLIGLFNISIKQFEEDDLVSVCEPPFGACFWLDDEQKAWVRNFEEKHNALIYMGILTYTEFGKLINWFYVSDSEEEWGDDKMSLLNQEACVYVQNYDAPDCSEFGWIGFEKTVAAGFKRVW